MPAGRFCHRVVIVGAGLSGLALAYRLERRGVRPRLLEAAPRIAEPWRRRHPQLRLNTHRHFSRLPGRPLPRSAGVFAGRDSVIRYLEAYARDLASPIEFGVSVSRIEPGDDGWCLETNVGEIKARHVVVATGRERVPVIPDWPGREGFRGRVRHAADFGSLDDYRDRRVLVAGAGNSGVDVLNHLARQRTRRLWVAVRGGTAILPKRLLGVPVQRLSGVISCLPTAVADGLLTITERIAFGDLRRLGLPRGEIGAATRLARRGVAPAIDDGFVRALEGGSAIVVPGVVAFEPRAVVLEDGRRLRPDIVICATGYRPGLEGLVGHLKVLDDRGVPRCQDAESLPGLPGLWFLGMQPRLFGQFQAACRDSRKLARCLLRS